MIISFYDRGLAWRNHDSSANGEIKSYTTRPIYCQYKYFFLVLFASTKHSLHSA